MGDCTRTFLTNHDVLPIYGDPVVPVWSRVLVPETNNVAQLMHHNAKLVAVLPYRDCLRDEGIDSKSTSFSGGDRDRDRGRLLPPEVRYRASQRTSSSRTAAP